MIYTFTHITHITQITQKFYFITQNYAVKSITHSTRKGGYVPPLATTA